MKNCHFKNIKYNIIRLGFLILIFGFGFFIMDSVNKESNQKIEIENLNHKSENEIRVQKIETENTIQETKIEYDNLDNSKVDTLEEIETKNVDSVPFFEIEDWERQEIINIVAGESEGESFEGKMAVAQCIRDSMIYENCRVDGVKWKFDGYNSELKNYNQEMYNECVEAVSQVFDDGDNVSYEPLLWFYNPNVVDSKWHQTQKFVGTFGSHHFYTAWE